MKTLKEKALTRIAREIKLMDRNIAIENIY